MDRRERSADDTRNIPDAYGGRLEIVKLEPHHASIYPYLREADQNEIEACSPIEPALQIAYCIAESAPGYAVEYNGRPIAIFGACGGGTGVGSPWLLATEDITRYKITFFKISKQYVDDMKARYSRLMNWVHVKNKLSIRWLKWLGFKFDEPKGDFMLFHWERGDELCVR